VCGRFTLAPASGQLFGPRFGLAEDVSIRPRWNIAPSTPVAVVRRAGEANRLDFMHWGLVPRWAKSPADGARMINARSETLREKRSFSPLLAENRCLVPADGFYEWQKREQGPKQPWYFHEPGREVFAFAGLWTAWQPDPSVEPLESVTIITREPNAVVEPVHRRMPAILAREVEEAWVDPSTGIDDALALLAPVPDRLLTAEPVSTYVNSVANDDPRCIDPAEAGDGDPASRLF